MNNEENLSVEYWMEREDSDFSDWITKNEEMEEYMASENFFSN